MCSRREGLSLAFTYPHAILRMSSILACTRGGSVNVYILGGRGHGVLAGC